MCTYHYLVTKSEYFHFPDSVVNHFASGMFRIVSKTYKAWAHNLTSLKSADGLLC
jgi:hypothetical protein